MAKAATKLFRELGEAKTAIDELKAKGYKPDEVVVVASEERSKEIGGDVKPISDVGKLAGMGVPEATVDYYKYVLPAGGVVVAVQGDEGRVAQAQEVLRGVQPCDCEDRACDTSPGFFQAGRMTATNPLDATMSGDFRRF
jgi:hypothetical protein